MMKFQKKSKQSAAAGSKQVKAKPLVKRVLSLVFISITLAILLITIVTLAVSSYITRGILEESSAASMRFMSIELDNTTSELTMVAKSIAQNTATQTIISGRAKAGSANSALSNMQGSGLQAVSFIFDRQGNVLASTMENPPASVSDLYVVQQALTGTGAQAITTSSFFPYMIGVAEPVATGHSSPVGGVLLCRDLSDNSLVDSMKESMGQDFTIFCGDTHLSTTITDDNGNRVVGTTMSEKVAKTVLTDGEIYSAEARILGDRYITKYAPILGPDGTPNGALFTGYNMEPYYASKLNNILINILIGGLMLAIMTFNGTRILKRRLKKPLEKVVAAVEDIAAGRMNENTREVLAVLNTGDEIGVLSQSMERAVTSIQKIATDTEYLAGALERKDLTVSVDTSVHQGIYKTIADVVNRLFGEIVSNMRTVYRISTQIYKHSEEVSAAAQSLAQGATEQAASVQELASTVNTVVLKVDENASAAREASAASQAAQEQVRNSSEQMQALMGAMAEITDTSKQIDQIIKTIDDIAFQTNILALNAAVEAARAGAAGKGFAVVADEVRNLASKSAEAAKSTAELIESTMKAIQKGTTYASQADAGLSAVVEQASQVNGLIQQIAAAAAEQAVSLAQINEGIEQIAGVVQANSGIAEETAASSNDLKLQTERLNSLVNSYRFRTDG